MKKILLLLVSGLLIACMAGSAVAAQITYDDDDGVIPINPNGPATQVGLNFKDLLNINSDHIAEVETDCTVPGKTLEARIINLPGGFSTDWAISDGAIVTKSRTYQPGATSFNCILEVTGNGGGYVTIRDIDTDASKTVEVYVTANVPEFPTVALPVAGILGLLFIFGRKKEGL